MRPNNEEGMAYNKQFKKYKEMKYDANRSLYTGALLNLYLKDVLEI